MGGSSFAEQKPSDKWQNTFREEAGLRLPLDLKPTLILSEFHSGQRVCSPAEGFGVGQPPEARP